MKYKKNLAKLLTATLLVCTSAPTLAQTEPLETDQTEQEINITCKTARQPTVVASPVKESSLILNIITFHGEYFTSSQEAVQSCEKTALAMQRMYAEAEKGYLSAEFYQNRAVVCLLPRRGSNCGSYNSEILFAFNEDVSEPSLTLQNMLGEDFRRLFSIEKTITVIYTELQPRNWWDLFFKTTDNSTSAQEQVEKDKKTLRQ